MSAVTYVIKKQGQGQLVVDNKKYVVFEAEVDETDTIRITELSSIDSAKLIALDNSADVSCTIGTGENDNVLTITQSGASNEKIVGIVVGNA